MHLRRCITDEFLDIRARRLQRSICSRRVEFRGERHEDTPHASVHQGLARDLAQGDLIKCGLVSYLFEPNLTGEEGCTICISNPQLHLTREPAASAADIGWSSMGPAVAWFTATRRYRSATMSGSIGNCSTAKNVPIVTCICHMPLSAGAFTAGTSTAESKRGLPGRGLARTAKAPAFEARPVTDFRAIV